MACKSCGKGRTQATAKSGGQTGKPVAQSIAAALAAIQAAQGGQSK